MLFDDTIFIIFHPAIQQSEVMLGKGLNTESNKLIKKSAYQQFDEKDYQKIIDEKDQIIRKLEFKLQKLEKQKDEFMNSNPGNANSFYRQKLEEEIKNNQTATNLFLSLSHRLQKLIELLKISPEISDDSSEVKNILKMMGEAHDSQHFDLDESEEQNMDVVQVEVLKKLQDLETVCDSYHKSFSKIQKQYASLNKRLNQTKKQYQDELKAIQKQAKQLRIGKQHFKNLQQKAEEQKKELVRAITNCLQPKIKKQMEKMSREDLIEYIKKLTFKYNQIELSKSQIERENKKIKTVDLQKYKRILNQVKQVKEMSRLGNSMM